MVDLVGDSKISINGTVYDLSKASDLAAVERLGTLTTSLTFNTAGSPWSITFTPDDITNYEAPTASGTLALEIVAYVGDTYGSGTAFGTIENALKSISSGSTATVWVVPNTSGNVIIKEDIIIKEGVSLVLPYGAASDATGRNQSGTATATSSGSLPGNANDNNLTNKVTLADGKKITIESGGLLEISGILSGGGGGSTYAGHTGGNHARLVLGVNSQIICEGTIKSYGYIHESYEGNGSSVTVKDGGTLYMPLVLRDFKGGSLMYACYSGMNDYGYSPFNQLMFVNVHPTTTYEYGGTCKVWANLYAGNQHNFTEGTLIGSGTNAFIQLTDSTYSSFVAKYSKTTDIMQVDIYGGAKTNALSLTVKILGTITMKSDEFVYGFSWMNHITLNKAVGQNSATYSMLQKYKLLPGCELTVGEGVTLNVGTLAVYEGYHEDGTGFKDSISTQPYPHIYPSSSSLSKDENGNANYIPDAKLIVNGSIIAQYLGGKVYTDNVETIASVKATNAQTITYEPATYTGSNIFTSINSHYVLTLPLELYSVDGTSLKGIINGDTYTTTSGVWTGRTGTITEATIVKKDVSGGCVTPDTLVTLADGSQKRIDEVTYEDQLLVWNFYTGEYAVVSAALIQNHGYGCNNIIKLTFSDGTVTKAVNEHGYFDATLNEFVMITPDNVFDYIGHKFVKANGDSYTTVTLVSAEISEEYVEAYSILAAYYYNFITDNMFSLTSPVIDTNFFMPFEVGENMTFDAEKMYEDIAEYGLYEYEDFEGEIPYEVFEALNIKYLKVAVGKGLITYDQIIELLKSEGVIE